MTAYAIYASLCVTGGIHALCAYNDVSSVAGRKEKKEAVG